MSIFRNNVLSVNASVFGVGLAALVSLAANGASPALAAGAVPGQPGLYESVKQKICPTSSCILNFDAVAIGATLQATNLNCFAAVVATGEVDDLMVFRLFERKPGNVDAAVQQAVYPVSDINKGGVTPAFGMNEAIRIFIAGGQLPTISAAVGSTVSSIQLQCTLTGALLK